MSNLKKILALVLALVMSMSLVTVASAAYEDQDQVDARYAEAVQVLSDMGIFKGYNGGANFGPKQLITREEVATIMYRVISTDLTDAQKGLYVEAAKFSDVANTKWSAGYIGYCYNGNYVKGYEDGTFGPAKNVTGYEVLAMILRAVGYDKNGEFSGSQWKQNIGSLAQQLGVLDNVAPTVVLSQPATRELVAELIFRTMVEVNKVEYTPFLSYQPVIINAEKEYTTLGQENFELDRTGRVLMDDWGRPGYYWFWNEWDGCSAFPETPVATYKVAACECELAENVGVADVYTARNVRFFFNGVEEITSVTGQHTAYDALHGGQGTLIEVYPHLTTLTGLEDGDELTYQTKDGAFVKYTQQPSYGDDIIVQIDTYLAEVTDVIEQELDDRNHVISYPWNVLDVYTGTDGDGDNYEDYLYGNKYAKGDFILVNVNELTATVSDLGAAKPVVGTQTINWYFEDKHTINDKDYNDAEHYALDDAGYITSEQFTWFMDQYGNVIGSSKIVNPNTYGIVTSVQWRNPDDENGYARATVMYMDGTTATKTLATIEADGDPDTKAVKFVYCDKQDVNTNGGDDFMAGNICTNKTYNDDAWKHLYQFTENSDGSLNLILVDDELTSADLYDGDPEVEGDEGTIYVDNATMFLIRSSKGVYTTVTGYDELSTNYKNSIIDYVENDDDGFVKFAYVRGDAASASATEAADFFMVTSKTFAKELKKDDVEYVVLYGIYSVKGNTSVVFKKSAAPDTDMEAWLTANVNKMFEIKTFDGVVTSKSGLKEVTATGSYNSKVGLKALFAGEAYDFLNKGVLVVENVEGEDVYYNVNNTTTIVNKNGKGTQADLIKAVEEGTPVYVVASYQFAKFVFITTDAVAAEMVADHEAELTVETTETELAAGFTDAEFWAVVKAEAGAYIFDEKPSNAYVHENTAAEDVMYFVYETKEDDSIVTLKIDDGVAFVNTNDWTGEEAGETHCFFVQVTNNGSDVIRNAGVAGTDGTLAGLGAALTTGYHTYSIVDHEDNVLLQGTFYIA